MAAAFSVGALIDQVKGIVDLGDQMNDLSQKVGISVRDLATWKLAAEQSGTSLESVAKGVKGLSTYMLENGDALKRAGISATDANGAMIQLADLFAAMPDGLTKTALAVKLFGKAGMDMIPMLNQGSKGLAEAQEKSRAYGERMAQLAPLADKFNDQLAELAMQSKETGMAIATGILPGMIGMATWLADIKAGGERAERALEFLSEKSPLFRGAVEFNRLAARAAALAGLGGDQSKRSASGKIGGPSGLDAAAEISLGDENEKVIQALRDAEILLKKQSEEAAARVGQGGLTIDVIFERVDKFIAQNIASGRGATPQALDATYGLNRAVGGY